MLAHQTGQVGINAAAQRCSKHQSAQLIILQTLVQVSRVRHHEIYSKRKGEAQFRHHRKHTVDTIRFFIDIQ